MSISLFVLWSDENAFCEWLVEIKVTGFGEVIVLILLVINRRYHFSPGIYFAPCSFVERRSRCNTRWRSGNESVTAGSKQMNYGKRDEGQIEMQGANQNK